MTAACPSIRFRLVLASMGLVLQFSGAVSPAGAQVLVPLSAEQARPILGSEDEFTRRMSAFDRSARMKTDQPVSTAEYLRFAASDARDWTDTEREHVLAAFDRIRAAIVASGLPLPGEIQVIKTSGAESLDAAYTRSTAIVFPEMLLGFPDKALQVLLAHEVFHVASRRDPHLARRLYEAVGFHHCGELQWPEAMARRLITNPDAPVNEYCIEVKLEESSQWVMPVLLARTQGYEPLQGGEYLDYLQFRLVPVERSAANGRRSVALAGEPRLLGLDQVSGYFEQVGRNTRYVIHPEEIVADNFALMIVDVAEVPSPEVLARVRDILANTRRSP